MTDGLGRTFEREIREQPGVWERLAGTDKADQLAKTVGGDHDVLLVGSGSSLFMAELGALAFRRRGLQAHWRAATEARLDHRADRGKTVVAISQSGRSSDVLEAVEVLAPRRLVALTNDSGSPLAEAADVAIDIGAGDEKAIPASKSVTATAAILLRAASLLGGDPSRNARALEDTAQAVRAWLDGAATGERIGDTIDAARRIARCDSVVILGSDYGLPVAREAALKLKEASYLHAEGFAAGEFRHGSAAVVDERTAAIGILDEDARPVVGRALAELEPSKATRYTIGCAIGDQMPRLGPLVDTPYNTLAWLVTAQVLALHAARSRGINSDAPRRLTKALVRE